MARRSRSRDLAGLAALGALGYTFFGPGRDRPKGMAPAPVEYRGGDRPPADMPFPEADMAQDVRIQRAAAGPDDSDIARFADVGTNINEYGEVYYPGGLPAAARAVSAGTAGAVGRPVTAVRPAAGAAAAPTRSVAPRSQAAASAPAARGMTRDEAIAQIPTGGTRTVEGGERVSGNEFTRNVGNILNAPVPGVMPFGRMIRGGAGTALRQPPDVVPALPAPARQSAAQARLPAPQARLTGPSRASVKETERAARQEQLRQQVLRENAANYGLDPTAPGYEAAMRALTRDIGGKDFTLKKKGGAVKAKPKKMASGGVSSASKRADGIASKGKTKCKMY